MAKLKAAVLTLESIQDYPDWRRDVQSYLTLKDLWDDKTDKPSVADKKAKSQLVLFVGKAYKKTVDDAKDAAAAWDELETIYNLEISCMQIAITGQLSDIRIGNNEGMADYVRRAQDLRDQLKVTGFDMPECITVHYMLKGLQGDYEMLVANLMSGTNKANLTFKGVLPHLLTEETRVKDKTPKISVLALGQNRGPKRCHECGSTEHLVAQCPHRGMKQVDGDMDELFEQFVKWMKKGGRPDKPAKKEGGWRTNLVL